MGLFSSIGGILGGIGGAIIGGPAGAVIGSGLGGTVGGAVDGNQANKTAQGYYNQQMDFAKQQAQFQQDYAKSVMQWRVEDAKKAGVHPMAALGVSNPSYSPVSAPSAPQIYDSSQFDTGSTFGQSLNRASMSAKTQAQQAQAASLGFQQIGLQNQGLSLDNQYKALQVAQLASELQRNAASSAPAPGGKGGVIGGQDDAVKFVPDEVTVSDSDNPSSTAGSHPLWSHARSGDFSLPVLSGNLADAVTENKEKNFGAEISYAIGAWKGSIKRPLSAYTAEEKRKLISGKYSDYYYPFLGWRVEPTMSWKNFQRFVLGEFKDKPRNGGGGATWR